MKTKCGRGAQGQSEGKEREEQPSFLCEVDGLSDFMGQISKLKMSEP